MRENRNGFLKERFADLGEAEIKKLLEEKDSVNTKKLQKQAKRFLRSTYEKGSFIIQKIAKNVLQF